MYMPVYIYICVTCIGFCNFTVHWSTYFLPVENYELDVSRNLKTRKDPDKCNDRREFIMQPLI